MSFDAKARNAIRRALRERAPTIALLAAQVCNSLPGPDPEAALVYLRELHELSSEALADADRAMSVRSEC